MEFKSIKGVVGTVVVRKVQQKKDKEKKIIITNEEPEKWCLCEIVDECNYESTFLGVKYVLVEPFYVKLIGTINGIEYFIADCEKIKAIVEIA